MKHFYFTALLCLLSATTHSAPLSRLMCAGAHVGTWRGIRLDDQITFSSTCQFTYKSPLNCKSEGVYYTPLGFKAKWKVWNTFICKAGTR